MKDVIEIIGTIEHKNRNKKHLTLLRMKVKFLNICVFRSNTRQQSLQEALDRLLLFHKNMISALTWLSSAESKVAELDSLVEASQTEESSNVEELQKDMKVSSCVVLFVRVCFRRHSSPHRH